MDWQYTDLDREIFERELDSFLPRRIYDAHAHLYDVAHFGGLAPPLCSSGPARGDLATYRAFMSQMMPGRSASGLFFAMPNIHLDRDSANSFIRDEARKDAHSRAHLLVTPSDDVEWIRETCRTNGFVGLKVYHCYADQEPTFDAPIEAYLPEAQVRLAHEEGMTITLHMVRPSAIRDRSNQETLVRWGRMYPNARWILAHAARGFNAYHVVEGISCLAGLENFWCDTSAVTEAGAIEAIGRVLGPDRLLFGTDFPVSHIAGRCVSLGDSFLWISAETAKLTAPYGEIRLALVGTESLRAHKMACLNLRLNDSQVENVFFGNAARLLGLGV
ncbi:MAG: amidohydrolase family protein [Planctomycetota bacterium]